MAKLCVTTVEICGQCPHVRLKGNRLGHGSYKHDTCTKTERPTEMRSSMNMSGRGKPPFWCPLPDAPTN